MNESKYDARIKSEEVWSVGEAKVRKDFEVILAAGDLNAAIASYHHLVRTGFPAILHEQFATLIVEKLKLPLADVLKLLEVGGALYPGDQVDHRHLRRRFIEQIVICAASHKSFNAPGAPDKGLFDALFSGEILVPDNRYLYDPFAWNLCAKAAEAGNTEVLEKLRKTAHWTPSCSIAIRMIQGDCSLFATQDAAELKELKQTFLKFRAISQDLLRLRHRPQNVRFFDEFLRVYGASVVVNSAFEYLVDCAVNPEKTKQLQFFLTRPAHANPPNNANNVSSSNSDKSFAQTFVDEVKIGDHCHLDTLHSDFETIDALCTNVDNGISIGTISGADTSCTERGTCSKLTKLDRLFPKQLSSADDSLFRLLTRNRKFLLDDPERLSRIRLLIDDLHHTLLIRGKLITPLRELTLHYF